MALQALRSHFEYWAHPDVALFVLRACYGKDVLQVRPNPQSQSLPGCHALNQLTWIAPRGADTCLIGLVECTCKAVVMRKLSQTKTSLGR